MRFSSGEHIIGLRSGKVVKARSVQPFPEQSQWSAERIEEVTGVPWNPIGTVNRDAHENQEPQKTDGDIDGDPAAAPPVSRGMPVLPKHLNRFGYTEACLKCRLMRTGDRTQPNKGHSEACKQRIRELCLRDCEFAAKAKAGLARTSGQKEAPLQGPEQKPANPK